eukprot:COSAG01_NODE_332_length_18712_cov_41.424358_15_plen_60_part_00
MLARNHDASLVAVGSGQACAVPDATQEQRPCNAASCSNRNPYEDALLSTLLGRLPLIGG